MDTTNKHDWGLVIAGVLLVICSMFFLFAPGLALVTIAATAEDVVACIPDAIAELVSASS